jgi:hypothetical protein
MICSPLRNKLFESPSLLNQLKKFLIYLLDAWNQRIGRMLGTVIGSLSPPTSNTICHLFQLQQVEIVLQNALHPQKGEITIRLSEHMRIGITDLVAFLYFKKQLASTYSLWERAHQNFRRRRTNIQMSWSDS